MYRPSCGSGQNQGVTANGTSRRGNIGGVIEHENCPWPYARRGESARGGRALMTALPSESAHRIAPSHHNLVTLGRIRAINVPHAFAKGHALLRRCIEKSLKVKRRRNISSRQPMHDMSRRGVQGTAYRSRVTS